MMECWDEGILGSWGNGEMGDRIFGRLILHDCMGA